MSTDSPSNGSSPETPPAPPEGASTPRPRDPQDRELANEIAAARQTMNAVIGDGSLRVSLGAKGYDTQKLNTGLALQIAAHATFTDRQNAMGRQEQASVALKALEITARQNYGDFRHIARATFKSKPARTTLGLVGRIPTDLQRFVTVAKASYQTAQQAEFQGNAANEGLAKFGYPTATLEGLITGLNAIDDAVRDQRNRDGEAVKATKLRDTAYGVLKNWMSHFRATAKVVFRGQPEQARKVDF